MFMFLGTLYGSAYKFCQSYVLDVIMSFMVFILVLVVCFMFFIYMDCGGVKYYGLNSKVLEMWCGLVPIIILVFQVFFSYGLLYYDGLINNNVLVDKMSGSKLDIKVVGHQWYWSYEYVGLGDWMKFDSYMFGLDSLSLGGLRLLDADGRLVLPVGYFNRINITSVDVVHSWFLPSYGFKMDAMPGMVNVHLMRFDGVGVYYGMCSEICGMGHSYMPIVVEVVPDNVFYSWVEDYKHKYDIVTRLGDWYKLHGVSSF